MTTMTRVDTSRNPSTQSDPGTAVDITPASSASPQDPQIREVVGGVDTHRDEHVAAVIDELGRLLGIASFPADLPGYAGLLSWMRSLGQVRTIGIEGTGAYGAGLARYLALHVDTGTELVEIDRPDRKTRRRRGKSDPIDAEAAARTALGRVCTGTPKIRDGRVESLRNLRVARRSAVEQRADVVRQMKSLIVTAPDEVRAHLQGLSLAKLVRTCAALRPDRGRVDHPAQAVKVALRSLAHRYDHLSAEIADLETLIAPLVKAINPWLLALNGVGPDCAGQFLVTAGENPERIHSEPAFAMLCGAAPIPASSGQTRRMRLNRGGDRQANAALYRVALSRLRWDPRSQDYINRRTTQDHLSNTEAIRCLKRYIAREIYTALLTPQPHDSP